MKGRGFPLRRNFFAFPFLISPLGWEIITHYPEQCCLLHFAEGGNTQLADARF